MAATDNFASNLVSTDGPATVGEAVTPHDTNELTNVSRGLWVGGAGNVAVVTSGGSTLTFVGVAAGTMLPIRVKIVKSTGTTATSIVAVS
jgi:hypothetical protein